MTGITGTGIRVLAAAPAPIGRPAARSQAHRGRGGDLAVFLDRRDGWIGMNGDVVPRKEAEVPVLIHAGGPDLRLVEGEGACGSRAFKLREDVRHTNCMIQQEPDQ